MPARQPGRELGAAMTRPAQGPTPGQGAVVAAVRPGRSRGPRESDRGGAVGPAGPWPDGLATCVIAQAPGAAAGRAKPGAPAFRICRRGLATLALLGLSIPAVHGQPAPPASAASRAEAPSSAAPVPASAASGRGPTMPPPLRSGSQSEAMQACRSLTGEQAQHDCMLRHQAMPPYGEGSTAPPRRRP